jgi:hypothetical protein
MKSFLGAIVILIASGAQAALFNPTRSSGKVIESVAITQEASVTIENQSIPVAIIGAGLRQKKVALAKVKVYVAELLSSDASKFVRNDAEALSSLDQSRTIAYRLNFVRSVDAPTVQASFADAFKVNNIDITKPEMAQFLSAVKTGGDANAGKSLTIVAQKNADLTESVFYEDSNGKVTEINGPQGFAKSIFVIGLGKGADAGVDELRAQIIRGL